MTSILKRPWAAALLVALLAIVSYSALARNAVVINYKLTLTADTPDGSKTGSGVIQVSYGSQFNLNGGGRRYDVSLSGEAVTLDLGRGKSLFLTLTNRASGRESGDLLSLQVAQDAEWLPVRVLDLSWAAGKEETFRQKVLQARAKGPTPVPFSALPTLITFRNLNDPVSVVAVQPDKLEGAFGPGYALQSATLELVDQPATRGIDRILPWLPDYYAKMLDGSRFMKAIAPNKTANSLASGDFSTFK
ncbi:MAG: hypothetical protein ACKVP5_18975 [Aestuariivirga sp.]